tara:strand:+ start:857 stop:1045 length:189 start_codon:yes stop_codon:yes gene_type:complete
LNICAYLQLDVAGVSAAYYLNIARIKVLTYVHNFPLYNILIIFFYLAVVSLLVFVIIADPFF